MLRRPRPRPPLASRSAPHVVTARHSNHVWHLDLSTVPTALGFWLPWIPFAKPQVWPFCWWVALAVDHFSRRVMGSAVYRREPSSGAVRGFLECIFRKAGQRARRLVTDRGVQFTAKVFRRWCPRMGIQHRFGAVGKYGSLAVIERSIRTLKNECTRRLTLVPFRLASFRNELAIYCSWHNRSHPHAWFRGATPDEIYYRRRGASRLPRFEPRPKWPRRSPCASPQVLVRGQPGVRLDLEVSRHHGRRHLPVITLRRAA
jgi:transposase InsO family protein